MIIEELKKRITLAMKERRDVEKEVLRVALGEIQTAGARAGRDISDDDAAQVLRKLVKSIEETRALTVDEAAKATLALELTTLQSLLPKGLSVDEVVEKLSASRDAIRAAPSDGQATGVAVKALKGLGLTVPGSDVSQAVKLLRA